jgi:hypothetical protein
MCTIVAGDIWNAVVCSKTFPSEIEGTRAIRNGVEHSGSFWLVAKETGSD